MSAKFETLSALMDNEANEFEARKALKQVQTDPELADTWRRYHLTRSLMKEQRIDSSVDLSGSIMARIDELDDAELTTQPAVASKTIGFWRAGASMAAAASITLAVLLGVQGVSTDLSVPATSEQGVLVLGSNTLHSDIVPTALSASTPDSTPAEAIPLILRSDALKTALAQHQAFSAADVNSDLEVAWLPEGYQATGAQVAGDTLIKGFTGQGQTLSLMVQPATDQQVSPGVYTQGGLLAYGERKGGVYLSVVGSVSLTEAQQIINSVTLKR